MKTPADVLSSFADLTVGVVGDLILDRYFKGSAERLCREAPVPAVRVSSRWESPGGGANAAANVAALGGRAELFGVVGPDASGEALVELLRDTGVTVDGVVRHPSRTTLTKNRVLAGEQLLVRYDVGDDVDLTQEAESRLIELLEEAYPRLDALIVSDYGYGMMTAAVRAALARLQERSPTTLVVDAKQFERYREMAVTAGKPNYTEAIELLGMRPAATAGERADQIAARREDILDAAGARIVAVTLDDEGALILERSQPPHRTYAQQVPRSMSIGAGDTFVTTLTLALASGADGPQAAELASAAAGVVVRKYGTAVCHRAELASRFVPADKWLHGEALVARLARARRERKRIVLARGVFDILHRANVEFLTRAKALGDLLVVAIGPGSDPTDPGDGRAGNGAAVNDLGDRAGVVAGLSAVDVVADFGAGEFPRLARTVMPDVVALGWSQSGDAETSEAVRVFGARVEQVGSATPYSTPELFRRIRLADVAPGAAVSTERDEG